MKPCVSRIAMLRPMSRFATTPTRYGIFCSFALSSLSPTLATSGFRNMIAESAS